MFENVQLDEDVPTLVSWNSWKIQQVFLKTETERLEISTKYILKCKARLWSGAHANRVDFKTKLQTSENNVFIAQFSVDTAENGTSKAGLIYSLAPTPTPCVKYNFILTQSI